MEGYIIRGCDVVLPGGDGISTFLEATLAARLLCEPKPLGDQWMGIGSPHRTGRYGPGGSLFFRRIYWSVYI